MIRRSESIKFLAMALDQFHADTPQVVKDSLNPHYGNRFTSLGAIRKTVQPYLHEAGLVLTQFPCAMEDGAPGCDSMLLHVSGEWLACASPLVMDKNNAQGQGGGLTYLERYAATAILQIVADEDDDAEKAAMGRSGGTTAMGTRSSPPIQEHETVNGGTIPTGFTDDPITRQGPATADPTHDQCSPKQAAYIKGLIRDGGFSNSDVEALVQTKAPPWPDSVNNLSKHQASVLIELLKAPS